MRKLAVVLFALGSLVLMAVPAFAAKGDVVPCGADTVADSMILVLYDYYKSTIYHGPTPEDTPAPVIPVGKLVGDLSYGTEWSFTMPFVSYSHENMREVFNTIRKLNSNRYRIWYDEGIEPGNEWPEEVGRAILNCSQFMVFMSPTAVNSRNVRNEINLATSDAKSILVIYLQETELSEGLRLQIGTVQNLNRYEMTEPEFLDKLKKVLSTELRS